MTEPLDDTWHSRDLPVLRSTVRLFDSDRTNLEVGSIAADAGLPPDLTVTALVALRGDGLIDFSDVTTADGTMFITTIDNVSGEARRKAGSWPSADSGADRIIAALEQIAENTDDEDTRSRARRALDALTGSGRQVAVSVAAAVITGQVT